MLVEVDVIKKVIYQFNIDAELNDEGYIDEEAVKEQAYKAFEEAEEDNTLAEHYYDEDLDFEYEIYV